VSEVTELIGRYKAGQLTLDQLAQLFRNRRWPSAVPPPPASYQEMAGRAEEDPRPDVPGSYDEVTAAYARRELTREEYDVLSDAVLEASRAQNGGNPEAR
jgi:hypothetical protein